MSTQRSLTTAPLQESELMAVLRSSLYPGAADESIKMVLGYCRAGGLDPMQKPVHIVPMWDSKRKAMRDVVMPGIGLYRTQASRNGCAGISEPEFGPDTTATIGGAQITYPQWCRVTVKRKLESGEIAEFTAKEFWIENYATKGGQEKSIAPNAMWSKRPYGQIAKCAEAQALRKAFPEVGSQPTADEMEGKVLPSHEQDAKIDAETGEIIRFDVIAACEEVEAAQTMPDLQEVWKRQGALAVQAQDKAGHAALKQAVIERRAALADITDVEAS